MESSCNFMECLFNRYEYSIFYIAYTTTLLNHTSQLFAILKFWALDNFITFYLGNDKENGPDKKETHETFYSYLKEISANTIAPQEERNHARVLLDNKKDDCKKAERIWNNII
ncbi:hypothetical protein C2G38_2204072 [Gigaspora rosea]|uniref:Uncharacterized protein n=1 Tax=Gigaspora rosea TaxID=44941 RepID=A0A397UNW6_9GLOM|nr:hypothetical protein C2G38_2204072 [Gigaspora rosea]